MAAETLTPDPQSETPDELSTKSSEEIREHLMTMFEEAFRDPEVLKKAYELERSTRSLTPEQLFTPIDI